MDDDAYWFEPTKSDRRSINWDNSSLRFTMLFGVLGIAVALLATPFLDRASTRLASERAPAGIDFMTTASTPTLTSTYTMRRSVLQRSPTAVCIIRADGTQSGNC